MLSWEEDLREISTQEIPQVRRWDEYGGICQRAWVEIDLAAVAYNVQQLKLLLSPQTALMTVVKADGYGHGAFKVAQTALKAGATWLGVATIPEGIELRDRGINAPILILGATHTPEQVKAIAQWQLQPTICTPKQALIFSEFLTTINQSLPVHVKLDTGMSRLGSPWQEAAEFVTLVKNLPNLELASIYSHLATADSPDFTVMKQQQQRFELAISACGIGEKKEMAYPKLHLANSAAALADRRLHYDMVRIGLATYGLYPAPHLQSVIDLKPVMQVKAKVTQVKTIQAGTGVSYGHHFIADREMLIAVVGIGYADGIPRNLSNNMQVLVRSKLVPQIGAITMDQMMLDVTAIPDLEIGEIVTLLGKDGKIKISADDWATKLGTISWEILCSFKHRLPRVAIG
ncbi:alanine racemase [Oscillatoriales cyanobacterium USR001]|nr:alanine racemase [Oscillatoriales cyanobacterium USR001]